MPGGCLWGWSPFPPPPEIINERRNAQVEPEHNKFVWSLLYFGKPNRTNKKCLAWNKSTENAMQLVTNTKMNLRVDGIFDENQTYVRAT